MSWQELEPIVKTVPNCKASIRVTAQGPKMQLSFSEPFFRELKKPKRAFVRAHPTEAKLLVVVDDKAGKFEVKEMEKGGGKIWGIPVPKWAPLTDREAEPCTTEKTPDGWVIGTPVQAWHNQTTYAAAIDAEVAKGAASKPLGTIAPAPARATPEKIDAEEYLRKKGWKCKRLSPSSFTLDGETVTVKQILATVNSERAKAHLTPLGLDDIR